MQQTDPTKKSQNSDASGGVRHARIDAEDEGQRLDNYLLRVLRGAPRSVIYRIVRKGQVRVNGSRCSPSQRLVKGDEVRIPPVRTPDRTDPMAPGAARDLSKFILYEDDRLIAMDKPAGLAVHGGSGVSAGVIEQLRAARPKARTLELVHRLDKHTSGVLLVAKRRSCLRSLHELIREGQVEKRYLALVQGQWQHGPRTIKAPLLTHPRREGERFVTVDEAGKPARSRVRLVELYGDASLVEVELLTGRTHQIRVHLAHAGHPLAGDPRYGDEGFNRACASKGLKRMFLHAHMVGFDWPHSGEPFTVSAPMEPALHKVLEALPRRRAARNTRRRR